MAHDRLIGRNAQDAEELGLEIMSFEDVFLAQADTEGNVLPVLVRVPGREAAVKVRPPTDEFYSQYLEGGVDFEDDTNLAHMINQAFPGASVTAKDVANRALPYGVRTMVDMIEIAGGKDMADALDEEDSAADFRMMQNAGLGMDQMLQMLGAEDESDLPDDVLAAMEEASEDGNGNDMTSTVGPGMGNSGN